MLWEAGRGMSLNDFKKWSKMTMITMWFWDLGWSVMKSMMRWDHGHCGVGGGISLPPGNAQVIFACAHMEQDEMYWLMTVSMFGHKYLVLSSWQVHWLTGCPVAELLCAQVISWPSRCGGT